MNESNSRSAEIAPHEVEARRDDDGLFVLNVRNEDGDAEALELGPNNCAAN